MISGGEKIGGMNPGTTNIGGGWRGGPDESGHYERSGTTNKKRQIDRLVYEVYELTDEEIAIVEEATG